MEKSKIQYWIDELKESYRNYCGRYFTDKECKEIHDLLVESEYHKKKIN